MNRIRLYHNPRCGTSRKVLAHLHEAGAAVEIIDYLATPPDVATLAQLADACGSARALLREKEPAAEALSAADDVALLEAIAAQPQLLNRPVVHDVVHGRALVCRPAEKIEEWLRAP